MRLSSPVKIVNQSTHTIISSQAVLADTFWSRMVGLIPRKKLTDDEALIITHCQSIHMVFMQFAIDVVFVDRMNRVVGLVKNIKPFQFSPIFWKASLAIELSAGTITSKKISLGDQLVIQ